MDAALIASATLLGLVGSPHCAAMCSAPCAAALGRHGAPASLAFHAARIVGYAAVGGLAASTVSLLATWSQLSPLLRPLWALLHAAALTLGLWLLIQGRQPGWLGRLGRAPATPAGWQRVRGPAQAAAFGALWFAWPCGLLQSALWVAAMGNGAEVGAVAMAGFALASAPGLALGPWAWRRLQARSDDVASSERLVTRTAGALLVGASAWALGAGLWHQVAMICATL